MFDRDIDNISKKIEASIFRNILETHRAVCIILC
jgi:hypothetical protein